MNINLLDLLNQIKKFALQEKGDLFSLLMYIFLSFIILNWYFGSPISLKYAEYTPYIALGLVALAVIIWLSTRRIDTCKGKINIGIAQFGILNTSVEKTLDAEQKMAFSNEVANYIYNSLNHERQSLQMDEYMHFFRLPSRIVVDYATSDKVSESLGADIIVRGTTTYKEGVFKLNYKVSFKKRINSIFFDKLINDINAYPDIPFDFSHEDNLECHKFIHMISYLSIVYKAIEYMNTYKFEKAEQLILDTLHRLNRLYSDDSDKSINLGDKDMVKVEILMYFILAKNYFNRANNLLENFDYANDANKKLALCAEAVEKQVDIIEKYLGSKTTFASHFEEMELQNEYIYAVGQLGKTRNKEVVDKRLTHVHDVLQDAYKFNLVQAFIETMFEDFDHAKLHYEKALDENPKNAVALRGLGMLHYDKGQFDLALSYLKRLDDLSRMHIFQPHMYDLKLQRTLAKLSIAKGHFFDALGHYMRLIRFKSANRATLRKMYVI